MKYLIHHKKLIAAVALLLLLGIVIFAKKGMTADQSSAANTLTVRPSLTVTVTNIQSSNWVNKMVANGSIAPWQESIIGTELNGVRLSELPVQVGDQVKRGQLLARFSEATLNTEVAQQEAALAEAEANLAEAASNARRAIQLKENGAISVQQINQYATLRNTAAAKLNAAKASLQAARLRLQQARVLAPDDGVISSRTATLGAVAQSGQELFRFIRQGKLEWRAEMTAEESTHINPGQAVNVFGINGSIVKGKVRTVSPTVDVQSRKTLVYVDLINSPDNLKNIKAGMFAKGEFFLNENNAVSVPSAAVVMRDGYASVFILESVQQNAGINTGKVKQLRVTLGRAQDGRTEILSGLNGGNNANNNASNNQVRIINSGAGFLTDGDTVRVVDADPALTQNRTQNTKSASTTMLAPVVPTAASSAPPVNNSNILPVSGK